MAVREREKTATAPLPEFELPVLRSVEETGLSLSFLADLVLKLLYYQGQGITGFEISDAVKLPFNGVLEPVMDFLKSEQFCEVTGSGGFGESSYQYAISDKGETKARELLERNMYVGPAPVTLTQYKHAIELQALKQVSIHEREMREALVDLVLDEKTFHQVGPAANSARFRANTSGVGLTAPGQAHPLLC